MEGKPFNFVPMKCYTKRATYFQDPPSTTSAQSRSCKVVNFPLCFLWSFSTRLLTHSFFFSRAESFFFFVLGRTAQYSYSLFVFTRFFISFNNSITPKIDSFFFWMMWSCSVHQQHQQLTECSPWNSLLPSPQRNQEWVTPTQLQAAYTAPSLNFIGIDTTSFVMSLKTYVSYSFFLNGLITFTLKFNFLGCSSALCWLKDALCWADRVLGWLIAERRFKGIETPACFNWPTRFCWSTAMVASCEVNPGIQW